MRINFDLSIFFSLTPLFTSSRNRSRSGRAELTFKSFFKITFDAPPIEYTRVVLYTGLKNVWIRLPKFIGYIDVGDGCWRRPDMNFLPFHISVTKFRLLLHCIALLFVGLNLIVVELVRVRVWDFKNLRSESEAFDFALFMLDSHTAWDTYFRFVLNIVTENFNSDRKVLLDPNILSILIESWKFKCVNLDCNLEFETLKL